MGLLKNILFRTDKKCLYKFVVNMGIKGSLSFARFQKRQKKGEFFPAFNFISVTDDCNLSCQGCWVVGKEKNSRLKPEQVDRIIDQTKKAGSYFFGILGGEPLLYKPLPEIFQKHSDCYFQLFTNGTLITPEVAETLRQCANVTPLISFEGDEQVADVRRGGKNVYQSANKGIENCTKAGLVTGVAISVCKSNLQMAMSPEFIQSLIDRGVAYLWYYIYRPVGLHPEYELALSSDEIRQLRQHMVDARTKYSIAIIDTYWDADGKGICPAASGLSHHINASGFVEPCPIIQFATDHIDEKPLSELYAQSVFLSDFRNEIQNKTNGCILMEDPQWLAGFVQKHKALNTSGRRGEAERLEVATVICSHGSCEVIPEKSWIYRFAKRRAFFGLGAYG
ncbi:MAG TPA: radical SAM protein [Prolixibacteraceae bacterium]|jgi:MoaA/NifB/PqqE/SkfB family radical SAM enzyme|nr:radical SAM protein [Prolixibacteraceae bacterium]